VVENCDTFALEAGDTAELAISFRPDFSSSVVKRDLLVATSQVSLCFVFSSYLLFHLFIFLSFIFNFRKSRFGLFLFLSIPSKVHR